MPRRGPQCRSGAHRAPRGSRARRGRDLRGTGRVVALFAGSSGFSYPPWKDGFYPPDARPADFLRFYAERLNSVELNTTFYRLPAEEQFDRWAAATPPGFRFAVTMTRAATSFGRIERLDTFAQTIGRLGERLGPVRIKVGQKRDDGFLRLLLDSLDPEMLWALDFRHDSWAAPEIASRLDERGVAAVASLAGAARFRYLRFRDPPYTDDDLEQLAEKLRPLLAAGLELYCYFRHEDEPTAPRYAQRLLELVRRRAT